MELAGAPPEFFGGRADGRGSAGRETPRRLLIRRAISFGLALAAVVYLALSGGGYDVVPRQEFALVVWTLLAAGFAVGVFPRGALSRWLLVPALAVLALLAWMLISLVWAESAERVTAEVARLLGYAGVMALALAGLNRNTFRAAAAGLSAGAMLIAILAVASRLFPDAFPGATDVARLFRADRLDYPLDYWNAVGAWGAMTAALGVSWSAHARTGILRAVSLAIVPVAGLAVYLSYSRGGVLAAAVALIAVLALSLNRWTAFVHALAAGAGTAAAIVVARSHDQIANATGGAGGGAVLLALLGAGALCAGAVVLTSVLRSDRARLPRETASWATPVFVLILVIAAVAVGGGPISRAWDEFQNKDQPAAGPDPAQRLTTAGGNRHNLWDSALAAWRAHPLDGIGAGSFEFWHERDARDAEFVRDAHSLYLEALAELGIPGFVLLIVFLGGSLGTALLARSRLEDPADIGASVAMSAAFCVFLFAAGVDWMWEETAVGVLALGGIAVAGAGSSRRLRQRVRRGKIGRPGVRIALIAIAVLAAGAEVPGLVSSERVRSSMSALESGDVARARSAAKDAIDAEPWSASPHAQLGLVDLRAGDLGAARAELEDAASSEPTNWRHPLVLSEIEAKAGDRRQARQTFLAGSRLAPLLGFYSPFSSYGREVFSRSELRAKVLRGVRRGQRQAAQ